MYLVAILLAAFDTNIVLIDVASSVFSHSDACSPPEGLPEDVNVRNILQQEGRQLLGDDKEEKKDDKHKSEDSFSNKVGVS
jgi:hypothetical protein